MHQEAVDTAVPVRERVDEDEGEGGDRRRHDGGDAAFDDAPRRGRPVIHEARHVLGPRADEMHLLAVSADGRADEILETAPVGRRIAAIDDIALQANRGGLVGRVEIRRRPQRGYEPLGARGGRGLVLDGERGARLLRVEIADGPGENGGIVVFDERARLLVHAQAHRRRQPRRAPDRRTQAGAAEQVVGDAVAPRVAVLGDDVPVRIQGLDVVAGARILEVQRPAGDHLVGEPRPPAEGARGFRPDPGHDLGGCDRLEGGGQHAEIEGLVAQRES